MPISNKKILIIDDHRLFADGLALILQGSPMNPEVTVTCNAQDALKNTDELCSYDLVLVDLHIPKFSGYAFLTALKTQKLSVAVAVISGVERQDEIERAIRLGAQGFIPKHSHIQELIAASEHLMAGNRYLPKQWIGKVDWVQTIDLVGDEGHGLTQRQIQVLKLMREGLQNRQIALALGVSTSAIKRHIELLFKHFNVNNRTLCVQTAQDLGVL